MRRLGIMAAIALVLAAAATASAQELNLANTSTVRPNIIEARTGLDHALLAELGYLRVLDWHDRQLFTGADVAIPWAHADLHDYRLRAIAGMPFGRERWKLAGWFSPTLRSTKNVASEMHALGVDLRLTGGYYVERWFMAAEAGLDWVMTEHITFSDTYRNTGYSGAKDGWYRSPGGTTYAGLHAGLSFESFDVVVRLGLPRALELEQQTVPFYLTIGVNVALP